MFVICFQTIFLKRIHSFFLVIFFILFLDANVVSQHSKKVTIQIVDETNSAVNNALICYNRKSQNISDSMYSDQKGIAVLTKNWRENSFFSLYIAKDGYIPKRVYLYDTSRISDTIITIRSRKTFWYDSRKIDSTHIGMTLREAITKYKLDLYSCSLFMEPLPMIQGITTELADSSFIFLKFPAVGRNKNFVMESLLNCIITGIGLADTKGNEFYFGDIPSGSVRNLYLWED